MAIWKEIRKALNSTLGTSGFKPLDKLMNDQTAIIEQYILRNKTFVPSNNPLITWDNEFEISSAVGGKWEAIGTFTPHISGFANVQALVYTLNRDYARVAVHILEDNEYKYGAETYNEDKFVSEPVIKLNNCEFLAGKTYTFNFIALTNTNKPSAITGFKYFKLNAIPVEGFPYNYTIGG